jgi:hypothetical protein
MCEEQGAGTYSKGDHFMSKKILPVAVVIVIMLLAITISRAYAGKFSELEFFSSEPHIPYTVEQRQNGNLRVRVQVDIEDREVREQYVNQQHQYALKLAESIADRIPIQVTFSQPLSIEELRILSNKVGLLVEHLTLELRDTENGLHTGAVLIDDPDVFDLAKFPSDPEGYDLKIIGVMVVRGTAEAFNLDDLVEDPKVYVVDVMPYLLTIELAKQYSVTSAEQIQVDVPSPHWNLSIEQERLQ